ncbi:hypothetical protein DSECCO2_61510 [anaerobic digester metagenome]|jgi:hypothetical protein
MINKSRIYGARRFLFTVLLLLIIPFSNSASCQVCNGENFTIDCLNLGDIDEDNLSFFQTVDPRDIGRALDISRYPSLDNNSFMASLLSDDSGNDDGAAVMNLETEGVLAMQEANKNQKRFEVPDDLMNIPAGSFSHLEMFNYTPSEWDQTGGIDEHCGNCWVFADTGALQLDMAYHQNMTEQLSVQYFTSSYHNGTGIWACCGGSPIWFADFYNTTKKAIPVTNTNASFIDSKSICDKGESTAINASYISTTPYYPIEQISAEMISTNSKYEGRVIKNETAINSIKAALHSEKAVLIVYTPDDWSKMMNYWKNQTSEEIFVPDSTPGATHNDGGHVMLILGYNDTDPKMRYWQILNSWGGPYNHPEGIFKLSMDLDYSLQCPDGVNAYEFYVLNVTYPEIST